MTAANTLCEKFSVFVIGKVKNSGCFKNVKALFCLYRSQRKSPIDDVLFEEWIRELDRKFASLLVENCSAHPMYESLKTIICTFFHKIPLPSFNPWIRVYLEL